MEGSPTNNSDALSTVSGSDSEEQDEFDVTGDDAPVLASRSDARTEVGSVQVSVRVRPFNANELAAEADGDASAVSCIQFDEAVPNSLTVKASKKGQEAHPFAFDFVFDPHTPQDRVYDSVGAPLLDKAFAGFNATIFAYGQTGSGKTFTMSGNKSAEGIIPRMNRDLFNRIAEALAVSPSRQFLVECSYFEIYNEVIYDLLDPSKTLKKSGRGLDIKEDRVRGVYIAGLRKVVVGSAKMLNDLMAQGAMVRTQAATNMNERSSRSHSIFTIVLQQRDAEDEDHNVFASINLVDLAGSERVSKTGATGDRLREGANINKSLSELGNVINKLAEVGARSMAGHKDSKKIFVPYRNSKLTRVLQNSLGGNSLCSMLATVSPAFMNADETLTTLRYADRAKSIVVKAVKNEETSQIQALSDEILMLKAKLIEAQSMAGETAAKSLQEKYASMISELEASQQQSWEDRAKLSAQYEEERIKMIREGEKQRAELTAQFDAERLRRRRLIEAKGDIELSIRELFGVKLETEGGDGGHGEQELSALEIDLDDLHGLHAHDGSHGEADATSVIPCPPGVDLTEWIRMVRASLSLVQRSREHATVATVYAAAVLSDIQSIFTMPNAADATVDVLTSLHGSVEHAAAKLDTLVQEGRELMETHSQSLRVLYDLDDSVRTTLLNVDPMLESSYDERPLTSSLPAPITASMSPIPGGVLSPGPSGGNARGSLSSATSTPVKQPVTAIPATVSAQTVPAKSPSSQSPAPVGRGSSNRRVNLRQLRTGIEDKPDASKSPRGKSTLSNSVSAPTSPTRRGQPQPPMTAVVDDGNSTDDGEGSVISSNEPQFESTVGNLSVTLQPYASGGAASGRPAGNVIGSKALGAAKASFRKMYGPVGAAATPQGQSGVVWFYDAGSPRVNSSQSNHTSDRAESALSVESSPAAIPITTEEAELRSKTLQMSPQAATREASDGPGGTAQDDITIAEQVEALKLILRQVMRHYVKVLKAMDDERQKAFALVPVFKTLVAIFQRELEIPLPPVPANVDLSKFLRGPLSPVRGAPLSTRLPKGVSFFAKDIEEYTKVGAPSVCQNASLIEVLTSLSRWGSYGDGGGGASGISKHAHMMSPGSFYSTSRGQVTYPARESSGSRLSMSSDSIRPGSRFGMGNFGSTFTGGSTGTSGGLVNHLGIPRPLREVSTGMVLFEGNDPMDGLQCVEKGLSVLKARLSYRLAVCHMSAMSRHLQKNDKISQLEQEAARLSSALAESMASVAAKEALLLRSETSRSLAETEVQRLSSRINEMQKHILDTAKDATSATTRLEMFTKDFQAAQDAARTASGEAAEARAKLAALQATTEKEVAEFCKSRDEALADLAASETRLSAAESECEKLNAIIAELQAQVLQLQQDNLRLEAEKQCEEERCRAQEALVSRHEKRVQYVNITVSALRMELLAKNEKNDELQELLDVAHDERDAAREKEEEYFNALRHSEDTISSLKKKLSHAVTKQQDFQAEVYETRASLERERAIALEYQQRALAATGIQAGSSSAAGSATDAVLRRRNDALIRAMVLRLYRVIATGGADSMKTPRGASNSKLDFSESSGDNSKQAVTGMSTPTRAEGLPPPTPKKEVEPRPPAAVNVATIPEDPTGSGGTGESGGIATRHTGSGRPVPHVRTPTAADPPSTPDAAALLKMGNTKSSRAIVRRGTPPGLGRPVALSASDVEQMPLEELVDQVIETWRSEAARLQCQIDSLQDKIDAKALLARRASAMAPLSARASPVHTLLN